MTDRKEGRSIPPRIAVIGLGRWGRNHVRVLTELGATVVSCHTRRRDDDAAWLARHHPAVRHTTSLSELLDDRVDGVTVVTPRQSHAELTLACLRRDAHVLVEKPAATTAADVTRTHAAARVRGLALHTGYTHRFDPTVHALTALARRATAPNWRFVWRKPAPGVGVTDLIWEFFPHVLSIAALFGDATLRPARVRASPGPQGTGTVTAELATGAGPGRIEVSSTAGVRQKQIELYDGDRLVAHWSDRRLHDLGTGRVQTTDEEPLLCQVREFLRAVRAPRPGTYEQLDTLVTDRLVELSAMAGPSAVHRQTERGRQ